MQKGSRSAPDPLPLLVDLHVSADELLLTGVVRAHAHPICVVGAWFASIGEINLVGIAARAVDRRDAFDHRPFAIGATPQFGDLGRFEVVALVLIGLLPLRRAAGLGVRAKVRPRAVPGVDVAAVRDLALPTAGLAVVVVAAARAREATAAIRVAVVVIVAPTRPRQAAPATVRVAVIIAVVAAAAGEAAPAAVRVAIVVAIVVAAARSLEAAVMAVVVAVGIVRL